MKSESRYWKCGGLNIEIGVEIVLLKVKVEGKTVKEEMSVWRVKYRNGCVGDKSESRNCFVISDWPNKWKRNAKKVKL